MNFKRTYWLAALAVAALLGVFLAATGRAAAFPGEPRGFEGFTWGTSREGLGPMVYAGKDDAGNELYETTGAGYNYGSARVAAVEYVFRDGRLVGVTFKVNSMLQYLLMKEEAFRRYGEGEPIAGEKDSYAWNVENTRIMLANRFTES
jgi:hypothetical protein